VLVFIYFELRRFLRAEVPSFENADVVDTAPKMGLRDPKSPGGPFAEQRGSSWQQQSSMTELEQGEFYTIPYRILLPQKVENLLMAGRFVGCTHEAQAFTPVMGTAVFMGQGLLAPLPPFRSRKE
jgi:hypothetical protein